MANKLIEVLQKFALPNNEKGGTQLDLGDVDDGIMEYQQSIIGKVRGEKIANYIGVKNFATLAWGYPRGLKVTELGPNVFQFPVLDAQDRERILMGGPWIIDNQILVLREWEARIEDKDKAFRLAPLWVQIWDLPIHWISKTAGRKIRSIFSEVREVIIP